MAGFVLKVHFHYQTSLQRLCNLSKLLICYRTPADGLSRGAADNFIQIRPPYQRWIGGIPQLPHTRLALTKRFTNLNHSRPQKNQAILCSNYWNLMNLNTSIIELLLFGLQGTHMEELNPINSKLMTFTAMGGLWTFSAILARVWNIEE